VSGCLCRKAEWQAAAQKAQADHANANLIHARLQPVNQKHPNLVAQPELDRPGRGDKTGSWWFSE
jgi:hypothetical protein